MLPVPKGMRTFGTNEDRLAERLTIFVFLFLLVALCELEQEGYALICAVNFVLPNSSDLTGPSQSLAKSVNGKYKSQTPESSAGRKAGQNNIPKC